MDILLMQSEALLHRERPVFRRYLFDQIHWESRLIGVKGARGTGKTTMLLQWLSSLNMEQRERAYFSLDDIFFLEHSLKDTLVQFYLNGGKVVVLDEVHKYPNWSTEIKNVHDFYPDLKIVFTGSSIIDLSKQQGDLSRRVVMYELAGMSYREYLSLRFNNNLPTTTLEELTSGEQGFYKTLPSDFRPLVFFQDYLKIGYYPFLLEEPETCHLRLNQLIRTIVEFDMSEMKEFDIRNAKKMLQLMHVIAQQVPFKPNISELASKTGIHRNTLNHYLQFLEQAKLISLLFTAGISVSTLQKPDKIYLQNTTLAYHLGGTQTQIGNVRETFFYSQVSQLAKVQLPQKGDFMVDANYVFEVGGKHKSRKQIEGIENSFVVKDDIERGIGNSIPLWAFGFLY
jgi:predicted AAA+ superfamily ATPase